MLINVEAQKNFYPGYSPYYKRSLLRGADDLAQKGTDICGQ